MHSAPLPHPPPTPRSTPPPPVRPTHPRGRSLPVLGRAVNGPRRLRQRIPWSLTTGRRNIFPSEPGMSQPFLWGFEPGQSEPGPVTIRHIATGRGLPGHWLFGHRVDTQEAGAGIGSEKQSWCKFRSETLSAPLPPQRAGAGVGLVLCPAVWYP